MKKSRKAAAVVLSLALAAGCAACSGDSSADTTDAGNTAGTDTVSSSTEGIAAVVSESSNKGSCGDGVTWQLGEDGVLTISGAGSMEDYEYSLESIGSNAPWFSSTENIKQVVIDSSVTSIGDYAFYGCSSLTSVTIPSSVTSIGDYAFECCGSLTSMTIPSSVTSIGDSVFAYCLSLTSVNVDKNSTVYSSEGGVLFNKDKTELVCYPGGKNGEYTIPSSVTSIGNWAFTFCDSLTSITIPSSVTSIGNNAFEFCDSLTSVTIPSSVTSIGYSAFYGCDSLTSVTIPSSVTSIGDSAFYDCDSLTSITIPSSVTSIGDSVFGDCSNLQTIYVEGRSSAASGWDDDWYYDSSANIVWNA